MFPSISANSRPALWAADVDRPAAQSAARQAFANTHSTTDNVSPKTNLTPLTRCSPCHAALPKEIWGEVIGFSARTDILNLRATNIELRAEADATITALHIDGTRGAEALPTLRTFGHLQSLALYDLDDRRLASLASSLQGQPPESLRVSLMSSTGTVSPALSALAALPLFSLLLGDFHAIHEQSVVALNACTYPILIVGAKSDEELRAAAQIPTLSVLSCMAVPFHDEAAALFSSHQKLQYLLISASSQLSSAGIVRIAEMAALRHFGLVQADIMESRLNASAASALAASPTLQNLFIDTGRQSLSQATVQALSHSRTIVTLRLPVGAGLHHLENMHTLETLILDGSANKPPITMQTASAIAHLPKLSSLMLRSALFEEDALAALLQECTATKLDFRDTIITPDAVDALLSNSRLREVKLERSTLSAANLVVLSNHPTLTALTVDDIAIIPKVTNV